MAIIVSNRVDREAADMKRFVIAAVCAGLILTLSQTRFVANLYSVQNESSLHYLAFSRIGASLLESRLDAWATINTKSNVKEMKERLLEIGQVLEIPLEAEMVKTSRNNDITVVRTSISRDNGQYFLSAQSGDGHTLLLVSVILSGKGNGRLEQCEKRIKDLLPAQTASQYTGVLPGEVSSSRKLLLIERMFEVFKAETIEVYKTSNAVSATGFTPFISIRLGHGKKQYNLQAAVRYNGIEDKTYIYLGTPLLLGEY